MWGNWLEKGKELAHKAQAAALDIDKKINESVGLETPVLGLSAANSAAQDEDDALNDAWAEEDVFVTSAPTAPEPLAAFDDEPTQQPPKHLAGDNGDGGNDENVVFEEVSHHEEEAATAVAKSEPVEVAKLEQQQQQQPVVQEEETMATDIIPPAPHEVALAPEQFVEKSSQNQAIAEEDLPPAPQEEQHSSKSEGAAQVPIPENVLSHDSTDGGWAGDDNDLDLVDVDDDDGGGHVNEEPPMAVPSSEQPGSVAQNDFTESDAKVAAHTMTLDQKAPTELSPVVSETSKEEPQLQQNNQKGVSATLSNHARQEEPAAPREQTEHQLSSELSNGKNASLLKEQLEKQKQLEQQLEELQSRLKQREDQLFSKTEQMTTMESMHENEIMELQQKVRDTKEEAKRRIQKAKERVQALEEGLKSAASSKHSNAEDVAKQAEIISALREEGQKLARKQADMEKAVRTAKGEARELLGQLEDETMAKEAALKTIATLENDLKTTRDDLASARLGEMQADKLEMVVRAAKEDTELKAATILSLEQLIKELKAENKELKAQLEEARKGAAIETEREQKKMARERSDAVADLDNKLRTSEREAAVREDALRQEVAELRKRWQDAVRRADSLSMDVQSSTAPLLRQLESADRQNRARAAAWAELENSLRAELEENVIANEKLSKERSEWKTKFTRSERASTDKDTELKLATTSLEEKTVRVRQLEEKLEKMEREGAKMKEEWAEVERLANEGVSRVRSEMTKTVVENEERYQAQLESIQTELRHEKEKRNQLERQVEELVEKSGLIVPQEVHQPQPSVTITEAKPKKLLQSTGQMDILSGALNGLEEDDDESIDDEEAIFPHNNGTSSFAALAELTSRLKSANVELNTLRQRLTESEESRERMVEELGEGRKASEKLPLFEARVHELTVENQQMRLEIQSLEEDIKDVRQLYKTQLNMLLEERATSGIAATDKDQNTPVEESQADATPEAI